VVIAQRILILRPVATKGSPKRHKSLSGGFCPQIITTTPRFFREAVILRWLIALVTPNEWQRNCLKGENRKRKNYE